MAEKENCFSGECPVIVEDGSVVRLSEGSGGREMNALIAEFRKFLPETTWEGADDDGAYLRLGKEHGLGENNTHLVFTSDSYVVTPIFFPGGNIGKIAFCGTVNDVAVMGAKPLGISLNLVIEEGLPKKELFAIIKTIGDISYETGIPIVTGDTKVMERGSVDKIIITTSGVGIAKKVLNEKVDDGDVVIVSGGLGEHGTALLAKRYEIEADISSDSKALHVEMEEIAPYVKQVKDITRGGLSAVINEIADKNNVNISLVDTAIPLLKEVRGLTDVLGIDPLHLACEGRIIIVCSKTHEKKVLSLLQKHNPLAKTIGTVHPGKGVHLQTMFGKRMLPLPSGSIVPRIC